MSPDHLELVASSARRLNDDPDRFGSTFYNRLFELAPETRALFPVDLDEQSGKLVDEIVFLAGAAGDLDRFLADARDLGARHARYGVRPEHFVPVGDALLTALETARDDWDDEMARAWGSLYRLVSEAMLDGSTADLFAG